MTTTREVRRDRHENGIGERESDANGRVTMRDWNGRRVGQGDLPSRLLP